MPARMMRKTEHTALDVGNALVGVCLALSPWVLGFTMEAAASWNAWLVGAAIALIAIGALVSFAEWEEWANLALGIWALISPWVLGFTGIAAAFYPHVIAGVIVAVLAAIELWFIHRQPVGAA
ncbi:SPW repeat [Chelatococcus sambhunathii]|nr:MULTISPECIES: SPW repeat protein [Chelatococcus]CUA89574.1 SPW repeat [Chelatococcus sambhunathii]